MGTIKININSKTIQFQEQNEKINNNHILNNNELYFDKNYFLKNRKIISNVINGIVVEKNISQVNVLNHELGPFVIDIINNIKTLDTLTLIEDEELSFDIYDKLLNANHIKTVNCFTAPIYMLDNLNKKNIKVNFRVEYLSDSYFIIKNKLFSYSKMYYKENIIIDKTLSEKDIKDFEMFLNINNHLKKINIFNFSFDMITKLIDILDNHNKRNIQILVRADSENAEFIKQSIPFLKILDKIYEKKSNIDLKIKYSNEYKSKNILKQITNNILIISCIVIGLVGILSFSLIEYNNYMTKKLSENIDNNIQIDTTTPPAEDSSENNNEPTEENNTEEGTELEENAPTQNENTQNVLTEDYNKLKSINSDTVGWLTVNNTKINYPVVKASNNDYYLNHDFYKNNNFNGWIYMDYENSVDELNQNTIIYGHNLKNGLMFGTLKNALNSTWYSNKNNLTIKFNTIYKKMNWQVFSVYSINVTGDYLYTKFNNDSEFQNFINKIKGRSVKNFGVDVNSNDKILTLSTCHGNSSKRMVIHAKLKK